MNRQDYLKIVLGFLVVTILFYVGTTLVKQENFNTCPYKNVHPDVISKEYLNSSEESNNESSNDFNDANTSSNNRNSEVQSNKLDKMEYESMYLCNVIGVTILLMIASFTLIGVEKEKNTDSFEM